MYRASCAVVFFRSALAVFLIAGAGLSNCPQAIGQTDDNFSPAALIEPPAMSWPTSGGNLYNQRYSPLDQINVGNVAGLKGVWRTHLKGSGLDPRYSGEAQPLVHAGVAYVITGADDVFAISIATGGILWEYRAELPAAMATVCCGWTSIPAR